MNRGKQNTSWIGDVETRIRDHEYARKWEASHLRRRFHICAEHQEWSECRSGVSIMGRYRTDISGGSIPNDRPLRFCSRRFRGGCWTRSAWTNERKLSGNRNARNSRDGRFGHIICRTGSSEWLVTDTRTDGCIRKRPSVRWPSNTSPARRTGIAGYQYEQNNQADCRRVNNNLRCVRAWSTRCKRIEFIKRIESVKFFVEYL